MLSQGVATPRKSTIPVDSTRIADTAEIWARTPSPPRRRSSGTGRRWPGLVAGAPEAPAVVRVGRHHELAADLDKDPIVFGEAPHRRCSGRAQRCLEAAGLVVEAGGITPELRRSDVAPLGTFEHGLRNGRGALALKAVASPTIPALATMTWLPICPCLPVLGIRCERRKSRAPDKLGRSLAGKTHPWRVMYLTNGRAILSANNPSGGCRYGLRVSSGCCAFVLGCYLIVLFQIVVDLFRDENLSGWWKACGSFS